MNALFETLFATFALFFCVLCGKKLLTAKVAKNSEGRKDFISFHPALTANFDGSLASLGLASPFRLQCDFCDFDPVGLESL